MPENAVSTKTLAHPRTHGSLDADIIIKNAPDPVFVSDLEGKILSANDAVYELLGFRTDEVLEQSLSRFISPEETREFTAALREVIGRGATRNARLNPRSASGEVIPTSLNASALRDTDGRVIGAIGLLRASEKVVPDLQESKAEVQEMKGEELCRKHTAQILLVDDDVALLQALPQALLLRLDGVEVQTCDSTREALKRIEQSDYDAIVSDIKMPGMDGLALLAKTQELRPETPILLITGHGEHELAIQALRGGAYDFIQKPIDRDYVVAALRRAIQTHQLRHQVRAHQRALELHAHALERVVQHRTQELVQANAAKDQFLSMVSQELSMPLSSLEGRVQLLRRHLDRADAADIVSLGLEEVERSIGCLKVLVTDLLDASLIETNRFVLHRQRCDLVALCAHLLEEYTAREGPTLEVEAPGEPLEAEVDPDRISQALLNVLANARKYAPQGSPITVTLHQAGFEAIIAVRDRGVGIPTELLPHLFEPYYSAPGQTGSQPGLGLGLYIAWKLVERHAGRMDVQSVAGEGSVFSMVLPLFVDPATEHIDAAKLASHTQAVWTIAPCG